MLSQKKNRFKPIFKKFIRLRENVLNNRKLFKFQRKKWMLIQTSYFKQLQKFRKFKPRDHSRYFVSKYFGKNVSYSKRFRDTLQASKRFRIFYGNLLKQYLKKKIKLALKKYLLKSKNIITLETTFIQIFETRLDSIIYRAKLAHNLRHAQQLILHGKVSVNDERIRHKGYHLKNGDTITFNRYLPSFLPEDTDIARKELNHFLWNIPPKHLAINYKTLQIIFLGNKTITNIDNEFTFNLRLQNILINYFRQS